MQFCLCDSKAEKHLSIHYLPMLSVNLRIFSIIELSRLLKQFFQTFLNDLMMMLEGLENDDENVCENIYKSQESIVVPEKKAYCVR